MKIFCAFGGILLAASMVQGLKILLFSEQKGFLGNCDNCLQMEQWIAKLGSSDISIVSLKESKDMYLNFGITSIPSLVILEGKYGKIMKIEQMDMQAVKKLIKSELKRDKMLIFIILITMMSMRLNGILESLGIFIISGGLNAIGKFEYEKNMLLAFTCNSLFVYFYSKESGMIIQTVGIACVLFQLSLLM